MLNKSSQNFSRSLRNTRFLFFCEHASFSLPHWVKKFFPKTIDKTLRSHQGWDQGALAVATSLAGALKAPLYSGRHSRLLIDLNRSLKSQGLWSKYSKNINEELKQKILNKFYFSFREKARKKLLSLSGSKQESNASTTVIVLCAIHSFTPFFCGKIRSTDIGLLFPFWRSQDRHWATCLKKELRRRLPKDWKIHFNLPYRGHTDCFLNDLIEEFSPRKKMIGIFLEINQKRIKTIAQQKQLGKVLHESFLAVAQNFPDFDFVDLKTSF